ncbi:long-chain fatty acid--CoA ligase [Microbulbifer flavimaris]|uniref:Long-chain fatty acid--CoA ligase n=1 Tax=Microbulbifer flavimaris TaxID=1781068 RepID=A0ABX4HYQ0_9GAMM|nr:MULTISPECIES: long-chain-fatty-acid--CoA ligase [Microbulbifer]KUJ82622.1 long-chain fatty acid--CoA ligase [Microbulbifer sp. ZGT114]PCO04832.1 long-chain fatty acid--CoA ligase [Microbulbifer flavimaris]
MNGLMMGTQLTLTGVMRHAQQNFPNSEIVSVTADNPCHRYCYRDAFERIGQLANALQALGAQPGDRIGTLAWNDYRHFELYYATSCSGLVCHTINPRLFAEQIVYIIEHAEDRWLFIDPMFVPLLEALSDQLTSVKGYILLTDSAHMPDTTLPNVHCYETLIESQPTTFDWPELDEQSAAALCYTSGTTGNPKGVLYSHRAMVLHTYGVLLPSVFNLQQHEAVLPVVPMFHVNAWSIPYAVPAVGAKLVFPGPKMADGETLSKLMNAEGVTIAAGVPTVWMALLNYLRENNETLSTLNRVVVGGSACPWNIMEEFEQRHGVYTHHAWGMTEMSPLGTYNSRVQEDLPAEEARSLRLKQGVAAYGVEMRIVDDQGNELPRDGVAFGALQVRGPWVCERYFKAEESALTPDGWFDTGDVATIDPKGYLGITDRTKDVIKSGGEWISSIELENIAMAQPGVAEAAVVGVPHEKWSERPLLVVTPKVGAQLDGDTLLSAFDGKVAKWWIPDDCVVVDEIPHTATGKISKKDLRQQFAEHRWPQAATI